MATLDATRAQPPERVIARLRPHARRLFWPALVLVAACAVVGYFGGQLPESWENILVFVGTAFAVVLLSLLPLVMWLGRRYVITTRRIIVREGFFVRIRQELMHSRGYDVSVKRNWMQSAFRSGDVRINSGLDQPLVLKDVPKANAVQAALHDLMDDNHNLIATQRAMQQAALVDDTGLSGGR